MIAVVVWYMEIPATLHRISPVEAWVRIAFCPTCRRYCRFSAVYPPIYPSLHRAGCTRHPRAAVELRIARMRQGEILELSGPLHFAAGPLDLA